MIVIFSERNIRLHLKLEQINDIPKEISHLTELKYLNLEHTNLVFLLDSLLELPNLIELNLFHNHITELPKDLGKLNQLEMLNLAEISLNSLP